MGAECMQALGARSLPYSRCVLPSAARPMLALSSRRPSIPHEPSPLASCLYWLQAQQGLHSRRCSSPEASLAVGAPSGLACGFRDLQTAAKIGRAHV